MYYTESTTVFEFNCLLYSPYIYILWSVSPSTVSRKPKVNYTYKESSRLKKTDFCQKIM